MATLAGMSSPDLNTMSARARARALEFPWSRFVERIDDHVDELAALRGVKWRRLPPTAVIARPQPRPATETEQKPQAELV